RRYRSNSLHGLMPLFDATHKSRCVIRNDHLLLDQRQMRHYLDRIAHTHWIRPVTSKHDAIPSDNAPRKVYHICTMRYRVDVKPTNSSRRLQVQLRNTPNARRDGALPSSGQKRCRAATMSDHERNVWVLRKDVSKD